jgi:hypothetical protein
MLGTFAHMLLISALVAGGFVLASLLEGEHTKFKKLISRRKL